MRRSLLWLAIAAFGLVGAAQPQAQSQEKREVTVFAAASLTNALKAAADAFTRSSGIHVRLSFASSSTLAKQIEAGAGAHLFFSADEAWMDYLAKRNLVVEASRRSLLGNRLAVVVPADKPLKIDIGKGTDWLKSLPAGRIATGDPAHVPVGRYAQQALTRLGSWDAVARRLARADNVRNALVLVERGEAAAGIVYATDAAASTRVAVAGLIPAEAHTAITYPVALVRGRASADAEKFLAFLASSEAKQAFTKHGFSVN